MISLKQIRYFIATAERGQITQAATDISISQSAVTTAIKDLENILAVKLFFRSRKGMELTTAGREFLSHAYEILQKLEEATTIKSISHSVEGELSIGLTYTVLGYFFPAHLDKLRRMFPLLNITLHEKNRETIEEGLSSGLYDISLLLTSNIMHPSIETEMLLSSPRRLWTSSNHPLLELEKIKLKDISKYPYIMLTVDEAAYTSIKYWSQANYQPKVILRTTSVEATRSLVANNQGVTILSDMVYRQWSLEGKRIETRVCADPIPAMNIGLGWRKNVSFTPAMEAFRTYFLQEFNIPH